VHNSHPAINTVYGLNVTIVISMLYSIVSELRIRLWWCKF